MASRGLPSFLVLGAILLVAGCGAPAASVLQAPPPSSSDPAPSSAATSPTSAPASSPGQITIGAIAATVVDALRVRSKPRISDDSFKEEPLLPLGSRLYVIDGPVNASGYEWFEVLPLDSRDHPQGWVAAASRDGEAWLGRDAFDCPAAPGDFRTLAALPAGVGLACFPGVPITVQARLLSCNCDIDGGWLEPSWFTFGGGPLLVAPAQTSVQSDAADWFPLYMDPAGHHDDVLRTDGVSPGLGQIVRVTGVFDHPASARCTYTEMDGEPAPTQDCRSRFAVTRLVVVHP